MDTDFITERLLNVATSRQRSELFVICDWDRVENLPAKKPLKIFYEHFKKELGDKMMLTGKDVLDEYDAALRKNAGLFTWIKCEHAPYYRTADEFVTNFLDYISFVPPNKQGILGIYEGHLQSKECSIWVSVWSLTLYPIQLNVTTGWVTTVFTGNNLAAKRRVITRNGRDSVTGRRTTMCFSAHTLTDAIKNIRQRKVMSLVT